MRSRSIIVVVVVVLVATAVLALLVLSTRSAPAETASAGAPPESAPAAQSAPRAEGVASEKADAVGARDQLERDGPSAGAKEAGPPSTAPRSPWLMKSGVKRVACGFACDLEERCTLRDAGTCVERSCEAERDVRKPTTMDYCLAEADSCLDAVACSCAEACWKRGECAGDHDHDDECARSCQVLARQDPGRVYRENRCLLENRCDAIAVCGGG